ALGGGAGSGSRARVLLVGPLCFASIQSPTNVRVAEQRVLLAFLVIGSKDQAAAERQTSQSGRRQFSKFATIQVCGIVHGGVPLNEMCLVMNSAEGAAPAGSAE